MDKEQPELVECPICDIPTMMIHGHLAGHFSEIAPDDRCAICRRYMGYSLWNFDWSVTQHLLDHTEKEWALWKLGNL